MQITDFFNGLLGIVSPYSISEVSYQKDANGEVQGVNVYIEIEEAYRPLVENHIKVGVHDVEERVWRHLDLFQYPCYLHCKVPKYKYRTGDKSWTKTLEVPWARKGSRFSLLFEQLVMNFLEISGCAEQVSKLVKEPSQKIWAIIDYYEPLDLGDVEEAIALKASKKTKEETIELTDLEVLRAEIVVENEDWAAVKKINLDETSRRKGHDYVSNIWNSENKDLLTIELGKSSKVLEEFVKKGLSKGLIPEGVKEFNIDMSPAFIKGIEFYFPNADINFDKFHVSQLVSRSLDTFRKSQKEEDGSKLSKWLILKPINQLSIDEKRELYELLERFPELEQVHAHKQIFSELWEMENEEDHQAFLAFWADQIGEYGELFKSRKLKTLAKTLNKHFEGILNAVKNGANNGFAEGMHSKIQAMKRTARGYKTFKRYVQMIRIHCASKGKFSTQIT